MSETKFREACEQFRLTIEETTALLGQFHRAFQMSRVRKRCDCDESLDSALVVAEMSDDPPSYAVHCPRCNLMGQPAGGPLNAIVRWNLEGVIDLSFLDSRGIDGALAGEQLRKTMERMGK